MYFFFNNTLILTVNYIHPIQFKLDLRFLSSMYTIYSIAEERTYKINHVHRVIYTRGTESVNMKSNAFTGILLIGMKG